MQNLDAFALFNEQEERVQEIIVALEREGVSIHFSRRDVAIGEHLQIDDQDFKDAPAIVVFLGDHGWSITHHHYTQEALNLEKRIIPVLIGNPDDQALGEHGRLFRTTRYVDLRKTTGRAIAELVRGIRRRPNPDEQIDRLIRVLISGGEEQKLAALEQARTSRTIDSARLGARLREELQKSGPDNPAQSSLLTALIACDPRDPETRSVVLRHLDPSFERDVDRRFATLAELHRVKAPFLPEALSIGDESPDIALLERAIASPEPGETVHVLRERLSARDFESVRPALRVLRVVPMLELAEQVGALLADVHPRAMIFGALEDARMARAAAPALAERFGVANVVSWAFESVREAGPSSARAAASVLSALDQREVQPLLEAARHQPLTGDVAENLFWHVHELLDTPAGGELYIAGFSSDTINVEEDHLDIREDAETLAAVMLAKEITPPLAIGLFGDWGTGKSFFMHAMRAASRRLQDGDPQGKKFCGKVVSIEFNAWHFVDTNLWASLVSHILQRLDAHVTPQKTAEVEQAELTSQLGSARAELIEAQAAKERAQEDMKQRQTQLEAMQRERQEKELRLADLQLSDLGTLLQNNSEMKKKLEGALEGIGVPKTLNNTSQLLELAREAESVRGRSFALFTALLKHGRLFVVLFFVVLAGIPLLGWILERFEVSQLRADATAIIGSISAFIGGVLAILRKAYRAVNDNLTKLEDGRQEVERLLAEKRAQPSADEQQLSREIQTLAEKEKEAVSKLSKATESVTTLEERMKIFEENRSLARFLSERSRSEDYKKHLGLISTIRQDFDMLAARLSTSASQGGQRVDRIVLYIDDLDRCPTGKVMDILQAVHLLLAYPLFVVVVAVDPRWLVHSLRVEHAVFDRPDENDDASPDLWMTTPQNYLEKIFQITFTLRPMDEEGYGKLVADLFNAVPETPKQATKKPADPPAPAPAPAPAQPAVPKPAAGVPASAQAASAQPAAARKSAVLIHEEALTIKEWESEFAQSLFALIPTPRAAKRFANTYRILKAPVPRQDLREFEGTAELPGTFQVPMLLLAILIGVPASQVRHLFPELQQWAAQGRDPTEALEQLSSLHLSFSTSDLERRLAPTIQREDFPRASELYTAWIPRVARFSFDVGRAVLPVKRSGRAET